MSFHLPQFRPGQPQSCNSLTVIPLYAEAEHPAEYRLADEAIESSAVVVQEISEGGSVPELLVENTGDSRVLFLEGEELRGAKQNRILNTSILVPAHAKTKVPVSCVERGRWRYASKQFASSKMRSPHSMHYALKASVSESLKTRREHRSDQGTVWKEVQKTQASFGFCSPTMAMSDTYDNLSKKMADYREQLKYPAGAIGVAVAVAGKVVCVDAFDKPATCEKAWDRILSGCVVAALGDEANSGQVQPDAVEKVLAESHAAAWTEAPTVGEGKEYRAEFNGSMASALMLDEAIVHLNLVMKPEENS
jgi:hypothetical protein